MGNKKNVREKGKIRFSEYFKELKNNDKVAVIQEKSIPSSYPRK
jgi:ribosomal protein L21E